jgi:hypothetical protein
MERVSTYSSSHELFILNRDNSLADAGIPSRSTAPGQSVVRSTISACKAVGHLPQGHTCCR